MQTNSTLSRNQPKANVTIDADFVCFDELQMPLKRALWEMAQRMETPIVAQRSLTYGMYATLQQLQEQERREIMRFADQYKRQTGQQYPFLAANATIQRYGFGKKTTPVPETDMHVPNVPRRRLGRVRHVR